MAVNQSSAAFLRRSANAKEQMLVVQRQLTAQLAQIENATTEGLLALGEKIKVRSQELCPKDTHALVNSAFVEAEQGAFPSVSGRVQGGARTVIVGYNKNGEAPYAVFVHEISRYHHDPPTQYKFLSTAYQEIIPQAASFLRNAMRRITRRRTQVTRLLP